MIACQSDFITEVMNECSYPKKWDTKKTYDNYVKWIDDKVENVMTFRDKTFVSPNTGVESLPTKTPWFENNDFTEKGYLNNG